MFLNLFESIESEIYLLKPKKIDILGLSLGLGFGYLRVFGSTNTKLWLSFGFFWVAVIVPIL
jgi:hypothetical protein